MFKKQKKMSRIVEDDEPLARYIFSKSHFSQEKKRVKRQAFLPFNDKLSVFRIKDCPEDCILKIGKKVESRREESLKAMCSLLAGEVRSLNNLDVESDTSRGQHRRHANINFSGYNIAKVKQIASELAELASKNNSLKIF